MKRSKKQRVNMAEEGSPSFCPFEGLFSPVKKMDTPLGRPGTDVSPKKVSSEKAGTFLPLKGSFSLRKEKKGRGGKTVTILSGSHLTLQEAEALGKAMRKALGCGSRVEGGDVLLQGDLRERGKDWLLSQGAKRVTVG